MSRCYLRTLVITFFFFLKRSCAIAKVHVEFYGEAGCPFCRALITGPLNDTLTADGVADIVDLKLSEFGNAFFAIPQCGGADKMYSSEVRQCVAHKCGIGSKSSADLPDNCFNGPLVCQHGPKECYMGKYAACAGKLASTPVKHAEFLHCVADQYDSIVHADDLAHACAQSTGIASTATLDQCYSSHEAEDLILQEAKNTPLHQGVPYVRVNGHALSEKDQDYLLAKVCEAYKGDPKPEGCPPPGTLGWVDPENGNDTMIPKDFDFYSHATPTFLRASRSRSEGAHSRLCV